MTLPIDHSALANNTTAHPGWRRETRTQAMITANMNSTNPTAPSSLYKSSRPNDHTDHEDRAMDHEDRAIEHKELAVALGSHRAKLPRVGGQPNRV